MMSSVNELKQSILNLKEKRRAVILAHNYQIPEVQDVADYVGDSLELSRQAAEIDADVIIFCGVNFMAESAAILSPEKKVILPEATAGCPMADMITAEELIKMKEEYPDAAVVCYVNSSAAVKAESDICCTSSNAVEVVQSIENDRVIFVPDQNLGKYVSRFCDKEIILWKGFCPAHHKVKAEDVVKAKNALPDSVVVVHPECRPEVIDLADEVASTSKIMKFSGITESKNIIVGTEMGMLYPLKNKYPKKNFHLLSQALLCHNMKKTTLAHVEKALINLSPVVKVEESIRIKAKRSLDRMLMIRGNKHDTQIPCRCER